jgi:hypothetical protein
MYFLSQVLPELTYRHIYIDLSPLSFDGIGAIGDISGGQPDDGQPGGLFHRRIKYGGGCKDPTDSDGNGVADAREARTPMA